MVMDNVDTLEYHRLIVGNDEAEYEATTTISEYIAMRAAQQSSTARSVEMRHLRAAGSISTTAVRR